MSRAPLRIMENIRDLRDTRSAPGAAKRRLEARITTLPGSCWAVAGVSGVFRSRAEAEAAARKLQTD